MIGLLAHLDTSPDAPASGVEPILHRDYDGGPIALPRAGTVLDPAEMPVLAGKRGHDIVSSSGDTLLGADDKAGMAAIMAAVAHLAAHPELPRPTLRIGFTPDEEIGQGPTRFDLERFGARCAYTLDASQPGELEDETFSAAAVAITVTGVDIHPGWAHGQLVNATRLAARIVDGAAGRPPDAGDDLRPRGLHPRLRGRRQRRPRDGQRDRARLRRRPARAARRAAARGRRQVAAAEPRARVEVEVTHQYPNMRRFIEPHPEVVAIAERAIRAEGIEPVRTPIRGGTDGAILSARGLPTPNLFTGGHEYHSPREWASVQDMASASATVVRLAAEWAEV